MVGDPGVCIRWTSGGPRGVVRRLCFCDAVEDVVVWAFNDGMRDRKAHLLSENYAPVEETEPVKDLPVKGDIPECMNGAFMSIGPNPRFKLVSRYHWFDGDGYSLATIISHLLQSMLLYSIQT